VKDVAAVLAHFGLHGAPLATARALLVAARHPQEAPDDEGDHDEGYDDDRDGHPNLASGIVFTPGTNPP
jgi:hypothetical protein